MSGLGFWTVTAVVLAVGYAGACLIWPWGTCSRCRGRGKLLSPTRRYHRSCPHCAGSGRLYRLPVRVVRFVRRGGARR